MSSQTTKEVTRDSAMKSVVRRMLYRRHKDPIIIEVESMTDWELEEYLASDKYNYVIV